MADFFGTVYTKQNKTTGAEYFSVSINLDDIDMIESKLNPEDNCSRWNLKKSKKGNWYIIYNDYTGKENTYEKKESTGENQIIGSTFRVDGKYGPFFNIVFNKSDIDMLKKDTVLMKGGNHLYMNLYENKHGFALVYKKNAFSVPVSGEKRFYTEPPTEKQSEDEIPF